MRAAAVGSKHWVGTWLLGKIADQAVLDAMGAPPSAATAFARPGRLPSGRGGKLAAAVGSKHWVGTWLLGKIADQAVPDAMGAPPSAATAFAHPGRLPSAVARKLSVNVPAKVLCGPEGPCEKSPFRSA